LDTLKQLKQVFLNEIAVNLLDKWKQLNLVSWTQGSHNFIMTFLPTVGMQFGFASNIEFINCRIASA
jgi:hypothetical protein